LVLILHGVVCGWCAPAPAQQAKEPEEPRCKLQVSVNTVLVPVVVRDRQHRAVGNLKKENFQVFDKDKLQVISAFSVENRGVTEAGPMVASHRRLLRALHRDPRSRRDVLSCFFSTTCPARSCISSPA
jgi:hypothetical protein